MGLGKAERRAFSEFGPFIAAFLKRQISFPVRTHMLGVGVGPFLDGSLESRLDLWEDFMQPLTFGFFNIRLISNKKIIEIIFFYKELSLKFF